MIKIKIIVHSLNILSLNKMVNSKKKKHKQLNFKYQKTPLSILTEFAFRDKKFVRISKI